jgi:hypothetical protein
LLAVVFALAHALFLPRSLEDIDSVNFALGVRDFDVADHRPHPPGYPAYIAVGKVMVAALGPLAPDASPSGVEARALGVLSLAAGALAVLVLYRVFASLAATGDDADPPWRRFQPRALAATALSVACPLYWYMAVRPMSDVPGLAVAVAAQACLVLAWWRQGPAAGGDRRLDAGQMAASGRMIVLGALLAGLAVGFRTQTTWLTVPMLVAVLLDRVGRGAAGALLGSAMSLGLGLLVWAVPLVAASGGLGAYLAALGSQAGEDFAGVEMLYLTPTPRLLAFGLLRTFIYPWDSLILGSIVLALAALGALALLRHDRRSLLAVALISVPYLTFHLLFQETTFVRYALPLVPPVAFLAITGIALLGERAVLPAAGALTVAAVAVAAPALAAYSARPSPTARALEAMRVESAVAHPGALGLHQTFRRPLQAEKVPVGPQLASPPRREWLELARYWREGNTQPVWFLADPRRSDLALIDPASRRDLVRFTADFHSLSHLGGMRPENVEWLRLRAPGWFAEEGWALTPETAGMARLMGRGPDLGPITAWVRRRGQPARILIGGRNFGAEGGPAARFELALDERLIQRWDAAPGFFLNVFDAPADAFAGDGPLARLTVRSLPAAGSAPLPTAIEQFDVQTIGTPVWGFEQGWHEAEYAPTLGVWHWTSERSTLRVAGAAAPLELVFRVESPLRYFDRPSQIQVRAGMRTLASVVVGRDQTMTVALPADALADAAGAVSIETDQTFVPAEREGSRDNRRLGLRVFDVDIRSPDTAAHR